jgi:hypothetical protein
MRVDLSVQTVVNFSEVHNTATGIVKWFETDHTYVLWMQHLSLDTYWTILLTLLQLLLWSQSLLNLIMHKQY